MSNDNSGSTPSPPPAVTIVRNHTKYQQVLTGFSYTLGNNWTLLEFRSPAFCLNESKQSCFIDMKLMHGKIKFRLVCEKEDNDDCENVQFKEIKISRNGIKECDTFKLSQDSNNSLWAECVQSFDTSYLYDIEFIIEHSKIIEIFENIIDENINLYKHIEKIYEEKICTDTKIIVQGNEVFLAHKMILAQSPVLAAMTKDNNDNVIQIRDVDPIIFGILLKFLYTGQTGKININANTMDFLLNLLIASHVYVIESLKNELVELIIKRQTVDNVIDILVVAERCDISKLKIESMSFIIRNGEKVQNTVSFQNMVKTNFPLTATVLCFILKYNGKPPPQ